MCYFSFWKVITVSFAKLNKERCPWVAVFWESLRWGTACFQPTSSGAQTVTGPSGWEVGREPGLAVMKAPCYGLGGGSAGKPGLPLAPYAGQQVPSRGHMAPAPTTVGSVGPSISTSWKVTCELFPRQVLFHRVLDEVCELLPVSQRMCRRWKEWGTQAQLRLHSGPSVIKSGWEAG